MFDIYEVNLGDSVRSIASDLGVDSSYLYKINGFMANCELSEGDRIVVPKLTSDYFDYVRVGKGKSVMELAKEYDVDVSLLAQINGLNVNDYIYSNQVLIVPKKEVGFYISSDGDDLVGVMRGMNANLERFLYCNPKIYLREGQLFVYKEK